jgi:hypothetical protein
MAQLHQKQVHYQKMLPISVGTIAAWLREGGNSGADQPAGGVFGRDAGRRIWTGWIDAPAPFFCGTVVPAIAASNPHIHFRDFFI